MNIQDITPGTPLLFVERQYARPLNVKVHEVHESGRFVKVQQPCGRRFWCAPIQLFPIPVIPKDPDGFTPSQRKVFDVVAKAGPIRLADIADAINASPDQQKKWTALIAGIAAKQLADLGRVKMERETGLNAKECKIVVTIL